MQKSTKNVDRKNTFMKISIISLHGYIQYLMAIVNVISFENMVLNISSVFLKDFRSTTILRSWKLATRSLVTNFSACCVNAIVFSFIIYR